MRDRLGSETEEERAARLQPHSQPFLSVPRFQRRISLCTDITHEKNIADLPQIRILTLSLRNLTHRISAYKRAPESMQHFKRTSKHGISMIISSQY